VISRDLATLGVLVCAVLVCAGLGLVQVPAAIASNASAVSYLFTKSV